MDFCAQKFWELVEEGKDSYSLIDAPYLDTVRRRAIEGVSAKWHATVKLNGVYKQWLAASNVPSSSEFGDAEWLVPHGYKQQAGEARIMFIHGGDASVSALSSLYTGLTTRLANWTRLPVLAFDFATEPITTWPNNVRDIFWWVTHALENGPDGRGRAGSIFFASDSEGALVMMHTAMAVMDDTWRTLLGFGQKLQNPRDWLAGIISSSPAVDIGCNTASFQWNCFNETTLLGDPDCGDCSTETTLRERVTECRQDYFNYFFGLAGMQHIDTAFKANLEWESRRDFFEMGTVNPLRADLRYMPPMLLIAGVQDYYYSDALALAEHACKAGVQVELFNVYGGFHDFIEYSEGCGGPLPMVEAIEAYRRIQQFTSKHVRSTQAASDITYLFE